MKQTGKIHDISGEGIQNENLSAGYIRPDPEVLKNQDVSLKQHISFGF